MQNQRILFICKNRELVNRQIENENSPLYCNEQSSGLLNSVKFVVDMLTKNNIECKVVDVADNNCIDKEVTQYKPTTVIIEALWVVPEKFEVLTKLHPKVKWVIRLHSELPFLAGEGVAINWLHNYIKYDNVSIAANSLRIKKDLEYLLKKPIKYLPNYYNLDKKKHIRLFKIEQKDVINIGCFGAIRPLKNQFIQAVAAMEFATRINKKLRFHINATRVEGKADSILKNIKQLFSNNLHGHELIEHQWLTHKEFVTLTRNMDILLQVSFSETYNIVAADAVAQNISVVSSKEISFISKLFQAECTSTFSIVNKLYLSYYLGKFGFNKINYLLLKLNSFLSKRHWIKYINKNITLGNK